MRELTASPDIAAFERAAALQGEKGGVKRGMKKGKMK